MANNSGTGYELMTATLSREGKQMRADLEKIREQYRHSGIKGDHAESVVRDFLGRYLPIYNRVGHGEVFNIDGLRSQQTDVVITNEYHAPLTGDWNRPQTFILEGVECGGEVKSLINDADDLKDCFVKARTFKSMFTDPSHAEFRATEEDILRFVMRRPYFGFAFESRLSLDRIIELLNSWNEDLRPVERPVLDSLFVLNKGSVIHMGSGQGTLASETLDGRRIQGYLKTLVDGDPVLSNFLLWIHATMPKLHYYAHPVLNYLQPNPHIGPAHLSDDGKVTWPLGRVS